MSRIDVAGTVAVGVASIAVAIEWSARNSLSVLVGGVIGLANLRLWQGIVRGLMAHQTVSASSLAGRFFLKLALLAGLLLVVLRSTLTPWAVMAGFGSVLIGLLWVGFFPSEEAKPGE